MTTRERNTTAEELLRTPTIEFRCELVKGELRKMPFAGSEEGCVAGNVGGDLANHVEARDLGRAYAAGTGFHLASNPDTVRAPDAAFVSKERLEAKGEVEGYWPGAPDLAIEVVSPNDTHSEIVDKSLEWLEAGCRMVIVVEPKRKTATVYRSREDIRILTEGEIVDGADVVPGWRLPVSEIFA